LKSLKNLGIAATLLFAVGVADARASLLTLVNGPFEAVQTPSAGNVNDVIPGLWGYLQGDLALNGIEGTQYLVTFTLFGSESGYVNALQETVGNTVLTEVDGGPYGQSVSYIQTAGAVPDLLQFKFTTPGLADLENGSNPDSPSARSFFVSFCSTSSPLGPPFVPDATCNFMGNATDGDVAWLALDDSGAGPDDNHDDWVGQVKVEKIGINQTSVPDGGMTAGLLGVALLGLGALRQKFNV